MSITRRLPGRRRAPDAFSKSLRLRFRTLELVKPREPHARDHARQSLAHQHHVHADIVFRDDVGETPLVHVEALLVAFEPHPAMEHEARKPVAGGDREGRGGVEAAADLRRIDPEQPHAPQRGHVDRVAVEHRAHEHEFGSLSRPCRKGGNNCDECEGRCEQ